VPVVGKDTVGSGVGTSFVVVQCFVLPDVARGVDSCLQVVD